jgi:hypothetical protein
MNNEGKGRKDRRKDRLKEQRKEKKEKKPVGVIRKASAVVGKLTENVSPAVAVAAKEQGKN